MRLSLRAHMHAAGSVAAPYCQPGYNPKTLRHPWAAAAPTPGSCTTATQPYTPSRIMVGGGVANGELPPTAGTSSGPDRLQPTRPRTRLAADAHEPGTRS